MVRFLVPAIVLVFLSSCCIFLCLLIRYFLLFLLYTCLLCVYSGVVLVLRFISCTNNLKQCSISTFQAVLCVLHFVEALVFGLFVSIMMFDQLTAIFENTPGIDALQKKQGIKRGKYESLKDVFAEPFNWQWFVPLNMPQKSKCHL